jgi:sugar/nucleoside kinase (ribokinase family)
MTRRYDVLVVSDYFLDLVFTGLPQLPELGQEIFGTGFAMLAGGGFNSVASMQRLGLRVAWVGDFGNDEFSRFALERAEAEGIDVSLSVRHLRPLRRITVAASYPHDRAFITYCDPEPSVPAAFKALAKASAEAVFLGGVVWGSAFDAGLLLVRSRRMRLIMDGNGAEKAPAKDAGLRRALHSVDLFLPNLREARHLTGESDPCAALSALASVCHLPVLKAGRDGAYAMADGKIVHAPAIPVTPVDTTGAGDCFNAGFIKAWLESRTVEECLRWGNAVGGLSTTAAGGAGRVITPEDVAPYL